MSRSWGWLVLGLMGITLLATPGFCTDLTTERLNVNAQGLQSNGGSWAPSMSADGRFVALHSWATDLVSNDTNGLYDVYLRDRVLQVYHLISQTVDGGPANGQSLYPSVSADGMTVAFYSEASNLVPGDTNGVPDIFVRDWRVGQVERVSVATSGEQANGPSAHAAVSGDGRYVAFDSEATNLIPGGNPVRAIYVRDRVTQTTECVSVSSTGELANAASSDPSITPDGRYVVFISWASNLVPNGSNDRADVYVRDRVAGTTECVSRADQTGAAANDSSNGSRPAITPDGRFVAFTSLASNLVSNDTNGTWDVFVRDRQTGRTELISVSSAGVQGDDKSGADSYVLAISADGRYVEFSSLATNLVSTDTDGTWDTFVRDRQLGTTERVSIADNGSQPTYPAGYYGLTMSADGILLVFDSKSHDLVPNDTSTCINTFLRRPVDLPTPTAVLIDDGAPTTEAAAVALTESPGDGVAVRFSSDGLTWTPWEPTAATRAWTLSSGDGLKRVYVQGITSGGTVLPVTFDEILLATTPLPPPTLSINGDAALTSTRSVTLAITPGSTRATSMRFANEGEDWSPWEPIAPTKDWVLSAGDGTKTVTMEVADSTETETAQASASIVLDTTPPTVSLIIDSGVAVTNNPTVTLGLTLQGATQMRFRNETGGWSAWEPVAAVKTWTLSPGDGMKTVSAQAIDAAGNQSAAVSAQILLDTTPPAGLTLAINGGAATTSNQTVTLTISATGATRMRFRNEAGDWSAWMTFGTTASWTLSAGGGVKTVWVQAANAAGDQSAAVSAQILLDTAPPAGVAIAINDGASETDSRSVMLTIQAEHAVEMQLRNESGAWSGWMPFATTANWALSSGDGEKSVALEVRDALGVVSSPVTAQITLDTTPPGGPSITINGGAAQTLSRMVTLTLAATGAEQMRFRNEGDDWSAWQPFASGTSWRLSEARGLKQVSFQAMDSAGNESAIVTAQIMLMNFSDVPSDYWAYSQIMACVDAGIVTGYPDGSYQPGNPVTRDQMAVYISRALAGGDANVPPGPAAATFADVPTTYWAFRYIEYLQGLGIAQGYPDGYHPADDVTRDQMAVYAARAMVTPPGDTGLASYVPPATASFPDVSTSYWAYKYIEYAKSRGVAQGYPDGEYHPEAVVTRDQMAVFVARAFGLQ